MTQTQWEWNLLILQQASLVHKADPNQYQVAFAACTFVINCEESCNDPGKAIHKMSKHFFKKLKKIVSTFLVFTGHRKRVDLRIFSKTSNVYLQIFVPQTLVKGQRIVKLFHEWVRFSSKSAPPKLFSLRFSFHVGLQGMTSKLTCYGVSETSRRLQTDHDEGKLGVRILIGPSITYCSWEVTIVHEFHDFLAVRAPACAFLGEP